MKLQHLILILNFSLFLIFISSRCNSNSGTELQHQSADSLSASYKKLFNDYTAIKDKRPDTVYIYNPVDSIRWVDSIRYVRKDSVVLIPHDTTIIHLKDSLVYKFRDSVIICYEERNFPVETLERYLNLFFRTENVKDTAGLHFNFEIYDGQKLSYQRDTLYNVPDSSIGWRIDWWHEK